MPQTLSTGRNPLTVLLRLAVGIAILVVFAGWLIPATSR